VLGERRIKTFPRRAGLSGLLRRERFIFGCCVAATPTQAAEFNKKLSLSIGWAEAGWSETSRAPEGGENLRDGEFPIFA
jgi:hypothetical protein